MNSSTAVDSPIQVAERPSLWRPLLAVVAVLGFFGFRGTGGEWVDFQVQAWFWDGRDWLVPIQCPDFTRGGWKTIKPLGIVS